MHAVSCRLFSAEIVALFVLEESNLATKFDVWQVLSVVLLVRVWVQGFVDCTQLGHGSAVWL